MASAFGGRRCRGGLNRDLVVRGKVNFAVRKRKEGIIPRQANILARLEWRSTLANNNRAGGHGFAGIGLHAQILRSGIAPVAGRALTFLMCHENSFGCGWSV